MFTSRAEYRLLLREDNADLRLTEIGYRIGLATEQVYRRSEKKKQSVHELVSMLGNQRINPTLEINRRLAELHSAALHNHCSLAQLLRRPEIAFSDLPFFAPELQAVPSDIALQVEVEIKYSGYVQRQAEGVKRFRKMEEARLPEDFDYASIQGLSREVREKLQRIRPRSLGQAYRISGITPAAISILSVHLKKQNLA
jgi:tRNA uridine 5-carboxymethylaminomethyl modification enzyme